MGNNNSQGSLDTNILLRYILEDVPEQVTAIEKLLGSGKTFEIADVAITEMVFVLEKSLAFPRSEIVEMIQIIIRNPQMNCNARLFELVMTLYLQQPKLSIIDCALLTYARLNKATPLYTFDKELVKGSEGDGVEPAPRNQL